VVSTAVPAQVTEYAEQVVEYVRRALGVKLEYDSDTLPLLDHYLRAPDISAGNVAATQLVVSTAGAYFGEVVRRRLGGRWELTSASERGDGDSRTVDSWRVVLPTGLNFSPAGMVAAAIAQADLADLDTEIDAPSRMRPYVEQALARMGEVTVDDYYSLCGRLDTLEHLHEVLVAVAAQMMGPAVDDDDDGMEPVADEPSGPVN